MQFEHANCKMLCITGFYAAQIKNIKGNEGYLTFKTALDEHNLVHFKLLQLHHIILASKRRH